MRKLQGFYIFKFESDSLKSVKNNINLNLEDARKNGELVTIGNSQVISSLFKIKGIEYSQEHLDNLLKERRSLDKNNKFTKGKIRNINKEIDKILFVPEIVSVSIVNKSHYKNLISSFIVNGKRFVRLLAGSGNIRRDTIIFCDALYKDRLVELLDAGRNLDIPLTPSKYSAYFALSNTATYSVSYPKFCVINDCEIERIAKVDWVYEDKGEMSIEPREESIKFNLFDGQGLISPRQAEKWALEVGLDYIPGCFAIRGAFTKGLLVTFDIHAFCDSNNNYTTKDVWGKVIDIRDYDIIFTQSQLKLWSCYSCLDDYIEKCKDRDLGYGIVRVSPKKDKTYVRTNYQFLQVLDLDDNQVESICQNTIDYFKGLSGFDRNKMLLYYLSGTTFDLNDPLSSITDPSIKALAINEKMQYEPYLRQHIANSLNKKIKDSYIGSLYMNGNYSTMISDPYALMEHCLGLPAKGLLEDKQHYSKFWNDRNVDKVAACRAPLTFTSEVNILNIQNTENMRYWYQYINSGIIYNAHGIDVLLAADSDFDFDQVFTTNQQEMIDGAQGGLPISYAKKLSPKIKITEESLVNSDINGMKQKIGFITNSSSSVYAMIEGLDKNSDEYKELLKRSKLFRYFQGENIDKAKNGSAKDMPDYWFKYKKINSDTPESELDNIKFNNSVLLDKRPYFFRYVYGHYNKRYLREIQVYDNKCTPYFGFGLKELIRKSKEELSDDMLKIKNLYSRFSYFVSNPSVMNKICWNMESKVKNYKYDLRKNDFDYTILMGHYPIFDNNKLLKMITVCNEYSKFKNKIKRNKDNSENSFESLNSFVEYVKELARTEISTDEGELASLAVYCGYNINKAQKEFAWKCFGDGIIKNMLAKNETGKITIPIENPNGNIEYLWKNYSIKEFDISNNGGAE